MDMAVEKAVEAVRREMELITNEGIVKQISEQEVNRVIEDIVSMRHKEVY